MAEEKPDFGSTTAVNIAWIPHAIRRRLTPRNVWSAAVILVVCTGYVMNAQHNISNAQADVTRLEAEVRDAKQSMTALQQELGALQDIKTQLAVQDSKLNNIADKLNGLTQWRQSIEQAAESPPHPSRRHRAP